MLDVPCYERNRFDMLYKEIYGLVSVHSSELFTVSAGGKWVIYDKLGYNACIKLINESIVCITSEMLLIHSTNNWLKKYMQE